MKKLLILSVLGFLLSTSHLSASGSFSTDTLPARKLFLKGDSLLERGKFTEAIVAFEAASSLYYKGQEWSAYFSSELKIAESLVNARKLAEAKKRATNVLEKSPSYLGNENVMEAIALNTLGECSYLEQKINNAAEYFRKSLKIFTSKYNSHEKLPEVLTNIGACFEINQDLQYDSAFIYYRKALRLQYQLTHGKEDKQTAQIYNNIGTAHFSQGKIDSAKHYLTRSLKIREQVLPETHPELSLAYRNQGVFLELCEHKYDSARYFYYKALEIEKERCRACDEVVRIYTLLGVNYHKIGQYDKAIKNYQQGLEVAKSLSQKETNFLISLADLYNSYGATSNTLGQPRLALSYHQETKRLYEKIYQGKPHSDLTSVNSNIASDYMSLKAYDKALEYYDKALTISKQLVEAEKSSLENLIRTYINIGDAYNLKENYKKSLIHYNKALALLDISEEPDLHFRGVCYNHIGTVYRNKEEYAEALSYYKKAQDDLKNIYIASHPLQVSCFENIGYTYFLQGNYTKSLKTYQKIFFAIENEEQVLTDLYQNPDSIPSSYQNILLSVFHHKAIALEGRYAKNLLFADLEAAAQTIQICDQILDNLRLAQIKDGIVLGGLAKDIYETAIRLNYTLFNKTRKKDYINRAFEYSEKSKGLALYLLMLESEARNFSGIPDSLLEQERNLQITISNLRILIAQNPQDGASKAVLFKKEREHEQLIRMFEKNYSDYYALKYEIDIKNIPFVQEHLLDKQTGIISYFIGNDNIYIYVITSNGYDILETPKTFPLTEWVQDFNSGIYGYWLSGEDSDFLYREYKQKYVEAAYLLYVKLFSVIQEQMNLPNRLIILPDEELNYVSFSALLTGQPGDNDEFATYPYLLRKHQIGYCYSATLLDKMNNRQIAPRQGWLGFAPSFTGNENAAKTNEYRRDNFDPLIYNIDEVLAIQKLMNGKAFLKEQASLENFRSAVSGFSIIHLSTHAKADNLSPDLSCLAFSNIFGIPPYMLLQVAGIYNLKLNSNMVVLSACETGFGKLSTGEGVSSLARAFVYAGAKNLTATLWSVNDQSSYLIMVQYYKFLAKGFSKDQALQQSQLAYLNTDIRINKQKEKAVTDVMRHPYYWAGFVTIGDLSPLQIEKERKQWWFWVAGLLVLVLLWIFLMRKRFP